jgi:hypothetical protein
MKARGILLAVWTVSAAMRAQGQSPDWFDAFRGKAYLQGDASYVAREKSAAPDSPPLFRARWIVLRYAGFTEKERPWWPYRNLLFVSMPSGRRFVLEAAMGFLDEDHLDEERPWQRVASERAAFEVWASGTAGEATAGPEGPCEGMRYQVRAPGGTATLFLEDLGSRTMKASLAEIVTGTFTEEERKDLASLLRLSFEKNPSLSPEHLGLNLRSALFALVVAMRDQVLPPDKRTVVLAPDAAAPADLAAWRGLAHLPLDLPQFSVLP